MKEKCILNFKTLQIIIIVGVGCVIEIEKICVQEREGPFGFVPPGNDADVGFLPTYINFSSFLPLLFVICHCSWHDS